LNSTAVPAAQLVALPDARPAVRPAVVLGAASVAQLAAADLVSLAKKGRNFVPALFVSVASFASAEDLRWATLLSLVLGLLVVGSQVWHEARAFFVSCAALLVFWIGPVGLPIFALAALSGYGTLSVALTVATSIFVVAELVPKLSTLSITLAPAIATAVSASFAPVVAALALVSTVPNSQRLQLAAKIVVLGAVCVATLAGLCEFRWLDVELVTHPVSRITISVGFVLLCLGLKNPKDSSEKSSGNVSLHFSLALILIPALFVVTLLRGQGAESVVFDEAHGDWASVSLPLGPEDFGRNITYSWRAIANSLEASGVPVSRNSNRAEFQAPPLSALYVLKMPLEQIDPEFRRGLFDWVGKGGRLLVVADHTDLFDTTQSLNSVLSPVGARIAATAVFDRRGQPPTSPRTTWFGFTWVSDHADYRYLTGSSFEKLPWWAVTVQTYGMSFAEQAVYFKANRFGYFQPDLTHPYTNHIAAAMLPYGLGSVQIWLDSTHWSTFASFHSNYQDAFWQAIRRSGATLSSRAYSVALITLCFICVAGIFLPREIRLVNATLAVTLGIALGGAASIRLTDPVITNSPNSIAAVLGDAASAELLTPIVESPSRNYARALTSLQKWAPVRLELGTKRAATSEANALLFIDLAVDDLPDASSVLTWINAGRRVVFLSDPRLLTLPSQKRWLRDLGFGLRFERGLSGERDVSSDLIGRRDKNIARNQILRFAPLAMSQWLEVESTHLAQAFVVKTSKESKTRVPGTLILSARSDQFSDAAIGDVWDGVPADDIAREREQELSRLVLGDAAVDLSLPRIPLNPDRRIAISAKTEFTKFLVVSQGSLVAEGSLSSDRDSADLSLAETPNAFARRLKDDALHFLPKCAIDSATGYCTRTLIDSKLTEWFVLPEADSSGRIRRLELIHEGRFSGVRHGLHVLFE
jgi:hypothetical protein